MLGKRPKLRPSPTAGNDTVGGRRPSATTSPAAPATTSSRAAAGRDPAPGRITANDTIFGGTGQRRRRQRRQPRQQQRRLRRDLRRARQRLDHGGRGARDVIFGGGTAMTRSTAANDRDEISATPGRRPDQRRPPTTTPSTAGGGASIPSQGRRRRRQPFKRRPRSPTSERSSATFRPESCRTPGETEPDDGPRGGLKANANAANERHEATPMDTG